MDPRRVHTAQFQAVPHAHHAFRKGNETDIESTKQTFEIPWRYS